MQEEDVVRDGGVADEWLDGGDEGWREGLALFDQV